MEKSKNVDKIDVEELIKEFKVYNVQTFISYLKEIWRVFYNNIGFSFQK